MESEPLAVCACVKINENRPSFTSALHFAGKLSLSRSFFPFLSFRWEKEKLSPV